MPESQRISDLFTILSDPTTLDILALLERKKLQWTQIVAHFGRVEPPIKERLDMLISEGYVRLENTKYSIINKDVLRIIKLARRCTDAKCEDEHS